MKAHFSGANTYKRGDAYFICDRCGQRHRRSRMKVEWDSLRVDAKCLDPRPPQMEPPDVYPEGLPFPDARPPQDNPDRLMDDTYLQSQTGGMYVVAGGGEQFTPPYLTTEAGVVITDEHGNPITVPGGPAGPNSVVLNPGALSPLDIVENPTPQGPNVLEDDITFITGPVFP